MTWITLSTLLQCNVLPGNLGTWHCHGCISQPNILAEQVNLLMAQHSPMAMTSQQDNATATPRKLLRDGTKEIDKELASRFPRSQSNQASMGSTWVPQREHSPNAPSFRSEQRESVSCMANCAFELKTTIVNSLSTASRGEENQR